jgi:hypothetical protein
MTDWFENDELFRSELQAGHRHAELVAARLRAARLPITVTPLEWRKDIADRARFGDERDIIVDFAFDEIVVEVKSRRLAFEEQPSSYPYNTALVDTVSGWNRKQTTPRAVVVVSQRTRAMLVVPVRATRSRWTVERRFDRVRKIRYDWLAVARVDLVPFERLLAWLIGKTDRPE